MSAPRSSVSRAAAILVERRRTGTQGARLPDDCRPSDSDTGWAIQCEVSAQFGHAIGGWKCALPVDDKFVAAPIYQPAIHAASPCPVIVRDGEVRIEPELAFVLARDLPPREQAYTATEVDAAVARTHLALELIDSRYAEPGTASFAEHLADGFLNQGLFLGPQVPDDQARACAQLDIRVRLADGSETLLDGHHPNSDPRAPLHWLAEFLRSKGQGLRAGQAVITGAYVPSFTVPAGQDIVIRYGTLGELTLRFVPR